MFNDRKMLCVVREWENTRDYIDCLTVMNRNSKNYFSFCKKYNSRDYSSRVFYTPVAFNNQSNSDPFNYTGIKSTKDPTCVTYVDESRRLVFPILGNLASTEHSNLQNSNSFTLRQYLIDGKQVVSALPFSLILLLGSPIELPSKPISINWLTNQTVKYTIGTRNAFATIGSSLNKYIASHSARKVVCVENFLNQKDLWNPNLDFKIKTIGGSKLTKPGNWFLFSQKIKVCLSSNSDVSEVTYIGLASCMSFNYFVKNKSFKKGFADLKSYIANESYSNYTPFSRYGNTKDNLDWTKRAWAHYSKKSFSDYLPNRSDLSFMSIVAEASQIKSTPLMIKFQKVSDAYQALVNDNKGFATKTDQMNSQLAELKDELSNIELSLQLLDSAETYVQAQVEFFIKEKYLVEEKISQKEEEIKNHLLQNTANQAKLNNLKKSYLVLKDRVEAEKQDAIQSIQGSKEYEQNLANEGFVVDDLSYKNKRTGEFVSAKEQPYVVADSNYVLIKVEMHTTKPIEIVFGNKSSIKKMTGPHKITISQTGNGSPRAVISPYSPFGAFWKTDNSRSYYLKSYPHTPNITISKTKDPSAYEKIFINSYEASGSVCLGELAATASIGFNQNDPNYVVMAIKSFIQSVNAGDYWGKDYVNFPNLNEINEKISFKQWRAMHKNNTFESFGACNTNQILFNKDKTKVLFSVQNKRYQKTVSEFLYNFLNRSEIAHIKINDGSRKYVELNIVKESDHSYKIASVEKIHSGNLNSTKISTTLQKYNYQKDEWINIIDTEWYEYDCPAVFAIKY